MLTVGNRAEVIQEEQRRHPGLRPHGRPGRERQRLGKEPEAQAERFGQGGHARGGGHRELEADGVDECRVHAEEHQEGGSEDGGRTARTPQEHAEHGQTGHGGSSKHRRFGTRQQDEEPDRPDTDGEARTASDP